MNKPISYRVLADYEVIDPHPLRLSCGDVVSVRREDPCWDGWVWVEGNHQSGWIPVSFLDSIHTPETTCVRNFCGADLSAKRGDELTCLETAPGWIYARHPNGTEGWFPLFNLRPAD